MCSYTLHGQLILLNFFDSPDSQSGSLVATLACPPAIIADMTEQMSAVTTLVHPNPNAVDQSQTSTHINTNDPVTKAVVDNIVGNLPTKKPQVRKPYYFLE